MRNKLITIFVVIWLVIFNYESCRAMFLNPIAGRDLPKLKFLFPPAGWIMFYAVGDGYSLAEVYGVKNGQPQFIDPHDILQTRPIGYDNIHRNVLITVLDESKRQRFCDFMKRKFAYFDSFLVTYVNYPSVTAKPLERQQVVAYECR